MKRRDSRTKLLAVAGAAVVMWACEAPEQEAGDDGMPVVRVGVRDGEDVLRCRDAFVPLARALEATLAAEGQRVQVAVECYARFRELVAALAEQRIELARLDAASYLELGGSGSGGRLLAVERPRPGGSGQGMIVVGPSAPEVTALAGLRGHSFAFGDAHAAMGRYLAQAALLDAGVDGRALGTYRYLHRADKVAAAVRLGEVDAGVVDEQAYQRANADGSLRVLARLHDAPRGWVARVGLPDATRDRLGAAVVAISAPAALDALDAMALEPVASADPGSYARIRAAVVAAAGFGDAPRGAVRTAAR
ncbi:PhnD/SsuA/transferrin family substrate-binding protein [Haliangium sp.]|uniref:PhnD/SsuA/transferrin family substrate-binding protein n=1 Tax=Haliangium sp. TaxID=2663208 RepID=UPI003D11F9E3